MSESMTSPPRKRVRLSVGSSHRAQELQDEAHNDLMSDLQRMVNHDDYGDVIFICKDGERVKAIRWLLVGRCNVFKKMLTNGMKETSLSEINLHDVSSQALLCVFEFLYTGTIVTSRPKRGKLLFDILAAAQFFLLPNLVGIVLELLLEGVSKIADDLPKLAAMLTMSLEVNHFSQEIDCDAINRALVGLLSSNWAHSVYVANLSEKALYYLLSHTKTEKTEPSLTEYYRFRQVILWWAYQGVSRWTKDVEEKVDSAVPFIEKTSSLYFDLGIGGDETTDNVNHSSLDLKYLLNASSEVPTRLLSTIDLRYMHFILFEKVVEPLNCFSSSDIMRALRFHASDKIARAVKFRNFACSWKHAKCLTLGGDGSSIENCGRHIGSAIALMQMSKKTRIHLWRFVIERDVDTSINMGFVCVNEDLVSGWGESHLDKKSWWTTPVSRILKNKFESAGVIKGLISKQGKNCNEDKLINRVIGKGSHVTFQIDFVEHNCSINLDGEDLGICWENLPDTDCYPVVTLGPSYAASANGNPGSHSGLIRIQTPRM